VTRSRDRCRSDIRPSELRFIAHVPMVFRKESD